jgi:hypothetical protein
MVAIRQGVLPMLVMSREALRALSEAAFGEINR